MMPIFPACGIHQQRLKHYIADANMNEVKGKGHFFIDYASWYPEAM